MTDSLDLTLLREEIQNQRKEIEDLQQKTSEMAMAMARTKRIIPPRTVEPEYYISLAGLTYLGDIATVNNAGGSSVAWTTFDCAPHHVPLNVEYVVLDFLGEIGTTAGDFKLEIRTKDGSPEFNCAAGSIDGQLVAAGPIFMKVVNAFEGRYFDYKITAPGSDSTWSLRLVGYVKRNWVDGNGFTRFTNPDGSGGYGGDGGGMGIVPTPVTSGLSGIKPTPFGGGAGTL